MGYANTIPYQQLRIYSGTNHNEYVITTVASSKNVAEVIVPSFKNPISKAYLSVVFQLLGDTSGGLNYMASGSYGIKDSGGTFREAETLDQYSCLAPANSRQLVHYWETSTVDLHTYITPGATQMVYLKDLTAAANNLLIGNTFGVLDLYFEV